MLFRMDFSPYFRDGILFVEQARHLLEDPRSLIRDTERGLLVRIRRGAYIPTANWNAASPREQHLLRIRAVLAAASRPIAIAGVSAAAVWGMPIGRPWPDEVTVLDEWRGGGRLEPGVRRTSAGFRTAGIIQLDGIPVTNLARTALDVARGADFVDAVGSVDWALWRRNPRAVTKEDLMQDLDRLESRRGLRRMSRSVEFATDLSGSYGESKCRVVIHLLGFPEPELQYEFRDAQGSIYPDFTWPELRKLAEFDGKTKYTRAEFTGGDPGETVWREKKREDRLRRMDLRVTRILTSDVEHPERLARLLDELGVPRLSGGGSGAGWGRRS
jgi:predicted transcriptional regulator of viral defense system